MPMAAEIFSFLANKTLKSRTRQIEFFDNITKSPNKLGI